MGYIYYNLLEFIYFKKFFIYKITCIDWAVCVYSFNFFRVNLINFNSISLLLSVLKVFVFDYFIDLFANHYLSYYLLFFVFRGCSLGLFCCSFIVMSGDYLYSLVGAFLCLTWCEREIWDMFGLVFINSLNQARILTDYGFLGFPLLKDYPLIGFFEFFYDFEAKSIKQRCVFLPQEFRYFFKDLCWGLS